jgi:hypothetical protein
VISEEEINNLPTKAKNYALKRVFEKVRGGTTFQYCGWYQLTQIIFDAQYDQFPATFDADKLKQEIQANDTVSEEIAYYYKPQTSECMRILVPHILYQETIDDLPVLGKHWVLKFVNEILRNQVGKPLSDRLQFFRAFDESIFSDELERYRSRFEITPEAKDILMRDAKLFHAMVIRYYKEDKPPHVLNALKYIIPQEIIDILPELAKEYLFKKLTKHTECDNIA